jgi:hypothetical protein
MPSRTPLTLLGNLPIHRRSASLGPLWQLLRYHAMEAGGARHLGHAFAATSLGTCSGKQIEVILYLYSADLSPASFRRTLQVLAPSSTPK